MKNSEYAFAWVFFFAIVQRRTHNFRTNHFFSTMIRKLCGCNHLTVFTVVLSQKCTRAILNGKETLSMHSSQQNIYSLF